MKRAAAEARGRKAERRAAWWLRLHGWRILGERLRVPVGEVDILARRGKTLAFIEVKWRERAADLDLAIDHHRLRRVAAAAEMLGPRYAKPGDDWRIDVMLLAPRHLPRHLVHVWQPLGVEYDPARRRANGPDGRHQYRRGQQLSSDAQRTGAWIWHLAF